MEIEPYKKEFQEAQARDRSAEQIFGAIFIIASSLVMLAILYGVLLVF